MAEEGRDHRRAGHGQDGSDERRDADVIAERIDHEDGCQAEGESDRGRAEPQDG